MLGSEKFVWIAASTHGGEEEIVLAAHKKLREKNPTALLILVPRHPDRFEEVAALSAAQFKTQRRSKRELIEPDIGVYLSDTMGELLLMYAAADVAFVGGSLIPRGGHNVLEPAALAKPLLTGPHLFNFKEITELFFTADALVCVNDAEAMTMQLEKWMGNVEDRREAGLRARSVMVANRGALDRQLGIVKGMVKV
jgi:3-deoxy-D-manno-octulosonic-acid transferase